MTTEGEKPGALRLAGWTLRRLVTTPATWLGAAAGVAVGIPFADVSGLGAGIGMGSIVAIGSGLASLGLLKAIRSAHARESASDPRHAKREAREERILEKLGAAGLNDDVDVLDKMFEARDAIRRHCESADIDRDAIAPTLEIVSRIAASAIHRSEELLDLARRLEDPLLDAPGDAAAAVESCRADLVRAYRAIADSRSRILLHRDPFEGELSDRPAAARAEPGRGLGSLTEQLEEETAVLQGIDRRLRGLDADSELSEAPRDRYPDDPESYSPEMETDEA